MVLKLVLAEGSRFATKDYGRSQAFRIFNEDDTAFNATTYNSPVVNVFDELGILVIQSISGSWTNQASGIGTFSFSSANHITVSGLYYLEVQLEKAGNVLSTERRKIVAMPSP